MLFLLLCRLFPPPHIWLLLSLLISAQSPLLCQSLECSFQNMSQLVVLSVVCLFTLPSML